MALVEVGDAIALVAVLGGGAGFLVRWLYRRQEARLTDLQNQQTEERLRADTAIRAVELLGNSESASPEQRGGALLALTKLGQVDFALELLRELWPRDRVTTATALWVIERALDSPELAVQSAAAGLLEVNAPLLVRDDRLLMVNQLGQAVWPAELPPAVRVRLMLAYAEAAGQISIAERLGQWGPLLLMARDAMRLESEAGARRFAGLWLDGMLAALDLPPDQRFLREREAVTVEQLQTELKQLRDEAGPGPTVGMLRALRAYVTHDVITAWMPTQDVIFERDT